MIMTEIMKREKRENQIIDELDVLRGRIAELEKIEQEHEKTVRELREREERLRLVTDNTSDMIRLTDTEGIFRYVSPSVRTCLGYDPEEMTGRHFQEYVHPDDLEGLRRVFTDALASGNNAGKFEYRYRHADGHYVWLESTGDFIFDESGIITGGVFSSRDITDRKRMEESLREKEALYRMIAERPFAGVYIIQGGILLFVSAYTGAFMGYKPEEMIGRKSLDFVHPEDIDHVRKNAKEMLRGERATSYEYRILTKQGRVRWIIESVTPIIYDGKRAALCTAMDITDRKWAEKELRAYKENLEKLVEERTAELYLANLALQGENAERIETARALRQSEERFRSLIESAPTAIMISRKVTLLYANQAYLRMFGYFEPAEIKDTSVLNYIAPEDIRTIKARIRAREQGRKVPDTYEIKCQRKDGSVFPVHVEVARIQFADGPVSVAFLTDITELKIKEKELRESREQLRSLAARLESLREEERTILSREIHDEFGQSLTGLKMDLAWLAKKLPRDQGALVQKADSMLKLVDESVKLIRKISTRLRPGILDDFGLLAAMEWQAREFDHRTGIRCSMSSNTKDIHLDKNASSSIFRVFQEALTNIARHSEATKVDVRLRQGRNKLVMEIQDNGRGLKDDEVQPHKSLGILGMRERVQLMEGTFTIQGAPGEGTRIRVSVPTESRGERGQGT
jgi:PAS domain S-box-containing protein